MVRCFEILPLFFPQIIYAQSVFFLLGNEGRQLGELLQVQQKLEVGLSRE